MKTSFFLNRSNKSGLLKVVFILLLVVECILIGMLIAGGLRSKEVSIASSQPLSTTELDKYRKYGIDLPGEDGQKIDPASVLALCTFQEEKTIGDQQYKLYTSDVLPQYIEQCSGIHEILEIPGVNVKVQYTRFDGEEVSLTITENGIVSQGIYAEKTDTFYMITDAQAYKFPDFRNGSSASPVAKIATGVIGLALVVVAVLLIKRRTN